MPDVAEAPRIYNLYPRLVGDLRRWPAHAKRARDMGFDWLYVNPVHFPGFSGSCYAIKDHYRIDPLLLPGNHVDQNYDEQVRGDGGIDLLRDVLAQVRNLGLRPMIDLVLNHTSRDAALVHEHPDWYVRNAQGEIQSPSAIDPADARRVTVWGDLAQLDLEHSPSRDALWAFWIRRVETYLSLGFEGFRCDAAYKVPAELWRQIISAAQRQRAEVFFVAETLGARLEEIEALSECGMQAIMNSSKYWAFDQPWCLEQQRSFGAKIRSISFPESHDTQRLWTESGGRLSVQKQRYAFAAAFSSGVMMPIGYEYGFEHHMHVVETRPSDWETPHVNLIPFITRVNRYCWTVPAFRSESVEALTPLDLPTLLLERRAGPSSAFIAINKDWHARQQMDVPAPARGRRVVRICREDGGSEQCTDKLSLEPAEAAYLV